MAENKAEEVLNEMSIPISMKDRDGLIRNASTSLNSKVVANSADVLAPIAVDAVMKLVGDDVPLASRAGG